jgi:hypothetical protein
MELLLLILNNPAFFPYVISIKILAVIAVMEMLLALLATGIFSNLFSCLDGFLDGLMPELNVPDADIPWHWSVLSALHIGKIPASILTVCFFTFFGITGICFQYLMHVITGAAATNWLVLPAAFVMSLFAVHFAGGIIYRLIPQNETSAVSTESFIGMTAVITLGRAEKDYPAPAKLVDDTGEAHSLMVLPYEDRDVLTEGMQVLLIERDGIYFKAKEFKGV